MSQTHGQAKMNELSLPGIMRSHIPSKGDHVYSGLENCCQASTALKEKLDIQCFSTLKVYSKY